MSGARACLQTLAGGVHSLAGMKRTERTNTPWERLQPLLPPQKPPTGRPALEPRRLLNGLLWRRRTGAPWRAVPARSGAWSPGASRFSRWRQAGLWQRRFATVPPHADAEGTINGAMHAGDGTLVRAPQQAAGAPRGAAAEACGRRPGGCSTTVPLRAADDQPVMRCVLSPGQRHAALGGEPCMVGGAGQRHGRGRPQHRPGRVVGDQASSSRTIRAYWRRLGLRITLPHKGNAHRSGPFHRASSRRREPVERLINRLQQHRRRATRYETCAAHDRAMWLIAATRLWL
jgi:transposase